MQDFSENFNSLFGNTIKWKPKQMLRDSGSIGKDYHSESAFKIWKKKKVFIFHHSKAAFGSM